MYFLTDVTILVTLNWREIAMHIISRKRLREFWKEHPESETPLDNWYRIAKSANWQNFVELQETFPSADLVGSCIVFNIGGNKYRLIVKVEFLKQQIYIKYVLTHKEYDKNIWKRGC
jgi:mRNA interferase HigB